jgi:hypothetical protein
MKSKLSNWLQGAVWCVACLLTLIPLFSGKPAEQFTGNVIATLFWMAVFYLFFLFMAPAFLVKKKLVAFFGISIVVLLILPFFGYSLLFLSRALFNGNFADFYHGYSPGMHLSGFKALALAGVYGSFFRLIVEHFTE